MPKITERGPSDKTRPGLATPPPAPDRHGRAGVGGERQDQPDHPDQEEAGVLWKCTDCSTRYAPGLDACPHCGGQDYLEVAGQDGDIDPAAGYSAEPGTPADADPTAGNAETGDTEAGQETGQADDDGSAEPADNALPTHPPRPNISASNSDWVDYACAVDNTLTRDDANGMTKADLVDKYGPRT